MTTDDLLNDVANATWRWQFHKDRSSKDSPMVDKYRTEAVEKIKKFLAAEATESRQQQELIEQENHDQSIDCGNHHTQCYMFFD